MAEASAEVTSDPGAEVVVSVLPGEGPVAERRRYVGRSTATSVRGVQKMAEASAEVTSDPGGEERASMLLGEGPVEERKRDVGGDTAVSVPIVQKMPEESAEVTSDPGAEVVVSVLPGEEPVAERRRYVGRSTATSVWGVQKMAEASAEVTSDPGGEERASMLLGVGPVEERKRDVDFSLKCIKDKWIPIAVTVVMTALIITIIALAAKKTPPYPPRVSAACPDGWVGYHGKCYYFSETEGNWSTSQRHCSSLNASLASIDSLPELDFMLRYKGIPYCWIGLHRERDLEQPWKWTNGTIFNNLFEVRGEGQCAFLDDYGVSSSRCYSERRFICSRPDECSRRQPSAAGGDTMSKIT